MKHQFSFATVIGTTIFFVFFHIYFQSELIRRTYAVQKVQRCTDELTQTKKRLLVELHELSTLDRIKEYTIKENMLPLRITSIKGIKDDTPSL